MWREHSLWGIPAPVVTAPGLSSCGSWALEHSGIVVAHRLGCFSAYGNLPGSGSEMEPVSPALAGGVFTTEPPGKPQIHPSKKYAFVFFITEYSESFNPYLVLGFFFSPIRPPQNRYPLAVAPCASLFLSPGTTDLLSFYMTLPNLNISYKWNHTVFVDFVTGLFT